MQAISDHEQWRQKSQDAEVWGWDQGWRLNTGCNKGEVAQLTHSTREKHCYTNHFYIPPRGTVLTLQHWSKIMHLVYCTAYYTALELPERPHLWGYHSKSRFFSTQPIRSYQMRPRKSQEKPQLLELNSTLTTQWTDISRTTVKRRL